MEQTGFNDPTSRGPEGVTMFPVSHTGYAGAVLNDYRKLIRNPTAVLNDWFYRCMEWLPGHPLLWVMVLGFGIIVPVNLIDVTNSPISHARSYTEVNASYFFFPVIFTQVMIMPLFYQAILKCFDSLRYAMNQPEAAIGNFRTALINPGTRTQTVILVANLLVCLCVEEFSSHRFSRFVGGDWNRLDLWLVFANVTALMMFLWYLIMPISRTLLLARYLEYTVSPRLFDDKLGESIAVFGVRAGLLFAIPYFFVGAFAPLVLSDSWTYLLPGVIGTVTAIGFSVVPAVPLRRIKRRLKNAEMEKINAAVARIKFDSALDLPVNNLSEIVTLLEYGRQVKALREWPFEARIIRAFGLYFLLVPLTWVGSAFVEMLVEQLAS